MDAGTSAADIWLVALTGVMALASVAGAAFAAISANRARKESQSAEGYAAAANQARSKAVEAQQRIGDTLAETVPVPWEVTRRGNGIYVLASQMNHATFRISIRRFRGGQFEDIAEIPSLPSRSGQQFTAIPNASGSGTLVVTWRDSKDASETRKWQWPLPS